MSGIHNHFQVLVTFVIQQLKHCHLVSNADTSFSNNIAIVTLLTDILENSHTCQILDRATLIPECWSQEPFENTGVDKMLLVHLSNNCSEFS